MPTYSVVLPLVPIAVGDAIERASWAPHVTLLGKLRVQADASDLLPAVLRRFAGRVAPIPLVVGEEAWFGPDRSVLVDLVEAPRLQELHVALLDALERTVDGLETIDPQHTRDGYRPHRTVTTGDRPARGDRLEASDVALVELDPAGRAGVAVVIAVWGLGRPFGADVLVDGELVQRVLEGLGGIATWVIGGWGVDALAGGASRPHHDLDLFVDASATEEAILALATLGFVVRYVWSENRWSGHGARLVPSAFVALDSADREIDVHTVTVEDGQVAPASSSEVELPWGALNGIGSIAGRPVPCATAEAQLVMHTGYALPERQRGDLELLHRLVRS